MRIRETGVSERTASEETEEHMHSSWSPLLLAMLVPSAHVVADNAPIYRVVLFDGVLPSSRCGDVFGQNLSTWPLFSSGAFGFATLGELGETVRNLSTDGQSGLCAVVEILADTLESTK